MITENTWAHAADTLAQRLQEAVAQGWGPEASARLRPVRSALDSQADEALAVITDQLLLTHADPCSARGLYIARILDEVQDLLAAESDGGGQEQPGEAPRLNMMPLPAAAPSPWALGIQAREPSPAA
ncbi:hypothetical protein AB0B10_26100 [Micromonospora arborensis]|uniref:hypothetical protein n=1 Tax=Micromonospora arborensis TaxID=2116518 RepID=UPI0033C6856A